MSFYEVTPHSLFQCFVEALDDDSFNVRVAGYSKTYVVFLKKFLHWLRYKFFALVRLQVYEYSSFAFR